MADLIQSGEDLIGVEPADLEPVFGEFLTMSLAKKLAGDFGKPWTDEQESELQEKAARLVGDAKALGLKTITMNVTRKNGQMVSRELDLDRINQTRSLQ